MLQSNFVFLLLPGPSGVATMTIKEEKCNEAQQYTIAASESLMIDYCNFVTTPLDENESANLFTTISITSNDGNEDLVTADDCQDIRTMTRKGNDTLTDFFRTLHKTSNLLYTEKQRLLNLPFPLMVAATLSDLATTATILQSSETCFVSGDNNIDKDTTKLRNTLFHRLQQTWMEKQHDFFNQPLPLRRLPKNRVQQRYYEWSPTLLLPEFVLPLPPQQHQLQQQQTKQCGSITKALQMHLNKRRDDLMQQAIVAQQQLLLMEATTDAKRGKGTTKFDNRLMERLSSERFEAHTYEHDIVDIDSDEDDLNYETNGSGGNVNINCDDGKVVNEDAYEVDDMSSFQLSTTMNGNWKQVHIRRKVRVDDTDMDKIGEIVEPHSQSHVLREHSDNRSCGGTILPILEFARGLDDTSCNYVTITSLNRRHGTSGDGSALSNPTMILQNDSASNIDTLTNGDVHSEVVDNMENIQQLQVPVLVEMIKDLKLRLQQLDKQRIEESQLAQKALQHERDVSYERIQALQLRLYISETRLQTYEEALNHHAETVQRNVATPITSIQKDLGHTMTPENSLMVSVTESTVVGSPLYARRTGTSKTKLNNHISENNRV